MNLKHQDEDVKHQKIFDTQRKKEGQRERDLLQRDMGF
jgi:hypothetical protein